jgi:hypothetical protein
VTIETDILTGTSTEAEQLPIGDSGSMVLIPRLADLEDDNGHLFPRTEGGFPNLPPALGHLPLVDPTTPPATPTSL